MGVVPVGDPGGGVSEDLEHNIKRIGKQTSVRIPLIAPNGTVLADSSVVLAGSGGVIVKRKAGTDRFEAANNPDRRIISDLVQCGQGNLILVGLGGIRKTAADGQPIESASCNPGEAQR